MESVTTRIGDAERDLVVEALRDHHAAGRLDVGEFHERVDAALASRTADELRALVRDLPRDPRTVEDVLTQSPSSAPDAASTPVSAAVAVSSESSTTGGGAAVPSAPVDDPEMGA